jgi:hypothetical protein
LFHSQTKLKNDFERDSINENEISLHFLLKHQHSCFVDPTEYLNTLGKSLFNSEQKSSESNAHDKILILNLFVESEEMEAVKRKIQVVRRASFTLIHETEIGMAIVKMDLQRFCNPKPPSIRLNLLFLSTLLLLLLLLLLSFQQYIQRCSVDCLFR